MRGRKLVALCHHCDGQMLLDYERKQSDLERAIGVAVFSGVIHVSIRDKKGSIGCDELSVLEGRMTVPNAARHTELHMGCEHSVQ